MRVDRSEELEKPRQDHRVELDDGTIIELPRATFRRQLRETRKRAGLTQVELSEKVTKIGGSLHATAITKIEKGAREVSFEEVLILALALDVSPLYLIFPRRDNELVSLTGNGEVHFPFSMRDWMSGEISPNESDPFGVSNFFARERPEEDFVLYMDKYLVYRFCKMLAATVKYDILKTEGYLMSDENEKSHGLHEPAAERIDRIEDRLRQVIEMVEDYVSRRKNQLADK